MYIGDLNELSLNGKSLLLERIAGDFYNYSEKNKFDFQNKQIYQVLARDENIDVKTKARTAALSVLRGKSIVKKSFDTRRVNQELDVVPRRNLQFWHRDQEFINPEDQSKIDVFAKLNKICQEIKSDFRTRPDWHDSYARILTDAIERALRIKQGDNDIDRAQLAYLEQLIDTRYRLPMAVIEKMSEAGIRNKILSKDENLLKRGLIYDNIKKENLESNNVTNENTKSVGGNPNIINIYPAEVKQANGNSDGGNTKQILSTLFGGESGLRRDGEKNVTRTITITINDNVLG